MSKPYLRTSPLTGRMAAPNIAKPDLSKSSQTSRSRRLMMIFGIGFLVNLVMLFLQIATLGSAAKFGILVGAIISITCAIAFLCAYKEKYVIESVRVAAYTNSAAIFSEVAVSGGVTGYFGHAIIIIPVMCALVLSVKDTIILSLLSLCALGGLVIFDGMLPNYGIDEQTYLFGTGLTLACTAAGIVLITITLAREAEYTRARLNEMLLHQTYLARHDSLTGLQNRTSATDYLSQLQVGVDRVEILLIDLDEFKGVNDSRGHAAGDEVLRQVAVRLRELVPTASLIARLGGDEFLIAIDAPVKGELDHLAVGEHLAEALQTISCEDRDSLSVSASVGSAVFPDDSETPSELLSKADAALYAAKKNGRRQFVRFTESANLTDLFSSKHCLLQRAG